MFLKTTKLCLIMSSKQVAASGWLTIMGSKEASEGFAMVCDIENGSLFMVKKNDGLYKCEVATNSWVKLTITPSITEVFMGIDSVHKTPIAIDCNQRKIMLNYGQGSIAVFELNDSDVVKLNIISDLAIGKFTDSRAIIINHEFHIIGAGKWLNKKHIKYDLNAQTIKVLHKFMDIFDLSHIGDHEIVRINNKILMFGGYDGDHFLNNVYEYSIETNKWIQLNCIMPKRMIGFGCVPILNEEYVALFGGGDDVEVDDDIFIFSVQNKTFEQSKIKCPLAANFRAFAFNDRKKDKIITFGYMRDVWKQCKINDIFFPPEYLVKIIYGYYWNEFVHLFTNDNADHYIIDILALLDF